MSKLFKLYAKGFRDYPNDDLIAFLAEYGLNLYYKYDNIFNYLKSKNSHKTRFFANYYENLVANVAYIYPFKLLIDSFIYTPVKTVFVLNHETDNNFSLSKGHKKIVAFDTLNLTNAHMLLVSSQKLDGKIETTEELYWLLRRIDPFSHNFHVTVNFSDNNPIIHCIESITTINKWSLFDSNALDVLETTKPKMPINIKFHGKAYTTDKRIDIGSNNYYAEVYSTDETDVSLDYIVFCSNNIFVKQCTKIGETLDSKVKIKYLNNNTTDFIIPNLWN